MLPRPNGSRIAQKYLSVIRKDAPHNIRYQSIDRPIAAANDVTCPHGRDPRRMTVLRRWLEEAALHRLSRNFRSTLAPAVRIMTAQVVPLAVPPNLLAVFVTFVACYDH